MDEIDQPLPVAASTVPNPVAAAEVAPPQRGGPPFGVRVIVVLILLRPLVEARGIWHALAPGSFVATRIEGSEGIARMAAPEAWPFLAAGLLLVATLILALGLWRGAGWAWSLAIIGTGCFMIRDLYLYATAWPAAAQATPWRAWIDTVPLYASMLLNTVIVIYFNQRDVRRAFGLDPARRPEAAR